MAQCATSKAGLLGLMRALSVEGRDFGISVNAIEVFSCAQQSRR
jgi:NAD(P)-dependent dehydrogenase (short-subunit alcohol dehydrogenase family)